MGGGHQLRRGVPGWRRRREPRRFGDLPEGAWGRIAKRAFDNFRSNGGTNLAAALTYRSVLSLFPALLALVALLGVVGQYPQTYDAVEIWQVAKWPVMAAIVVNLVAILYYLTPNVRPPSLRWITPGAVVSLVAWIFLSAAFAAYVGHFGSYNKTYGTLGAAITFLVWLWFTNTTILIGAQIDAEMERERELAAGIDAEERIQLPLRQSE